MKVAGITSAAWYRKPKHGKEKARKIIGHFIQENNRHWLIHRLGLYSPLEYREAYEKRRKYAA